MRRHALRALRRAPGTWRLAILAAMLVVCWFAVNWIYQVVRKPSELFFPVSGTLNKVPAETWRQYGPLFEKYSTRLISPELLAALAQVEGSGNPVAQTYWRWAWRPRAFDIYKPASSAVGMYQITDGTFAEARKYCIRDHAVVADGPWNDWHSCWFNGLYLRVLPSHAIELTAAYLDRSATLALKDRHPRDASARMPELAAVIHLCGAAAGESYVLHGMRLSEAQHCGEQEAREYVARVEAARRIFVALRAGGAGGAAVEYDKPMPSCRKSETTSNADGQVRGPSLIGCVHDPAVASMRGLAR
jgi:hypothetical protein